MDNGPPSTSINRIDQLSPIYLDSANEVNQGPPSTRHQLSSLTHSILLSPSPQSVSPFFSHSTSTRKTHSTSPTSYERGSSFTGSKQYENVEAIDSTATKSMVGLATSLVDSGDIVHLPLQRHKRLSDSTSENEIVEQSKRRSKALPECCMVCSENKTVEWRKGPAGSRSLCNGCGLQAAKRANERKARGTPEPATVQEIEIEIGRIGQDRFTSRGQTFTSPSNLADRISGNLKRTKQDEVVKANLDQAKEANQAAVSLLGLANPPQRSRSVGAVTSTSSSTISTRRDRAYSYEPNYTSSDFSLPFPAQSSGPLPTSSNIDQFLPPPRQYSPPLFSPQLRSTLVLPPPSTLSIPSTGFVQSSRRMSIDYISPTVDSTEPVPSNFFEGAEQFREDEEQGEAGSNIGKSLL